MRYSPPSMKIKLKEIIDVYKVKFADIKARIHDVKSPFIQEKMKSVNEHSAGRHDSNDPESQNLLNIHSEMTNQDENLVKARRLGHDSLQKQEEAK